MRIRVGFVQTAVAGAFGLGLALSGPVSFADEDVELEELSPEAQQAVKTAVGDGEINEIEREEEDGRVIYEVEYERDGEDFEMKVTEQGKVLENEED